MTNAKPCYATLHNYGLEQEFRPILKPMASTIVLPMLQIMKPHQITQPTFYNNYKSAYKCPPGTDFSVPNYGALYEKEVHQGIDYYNQM